jgi:hypothetical protein
MQGLFKKLLAEAVDRLVLQYARVTTNRAPIAIWLVNFEVDGEKTHAVYDLLLNKVSASSNRHTSVY